MQIDVQTYLDLVEQTDNICFWDLECTGLKGDYNSVLVSTIKPFNSDPITLSVKQVGNDQKVVRETAEALAGFQCVVGYYSSGFDMPMCNTRLLKWKQRPIAPMHHIDLYYKLKSKLLTARKSQGHLLSFLGTPEQKLSVGASVWSEIPFKFSEHMPLMIERCESDVRGLQELYTATRHLIADVKRG